MNVKELTGFNMEDKKRKKHWSAGDKAFLKSHYNTLEVQELADKMQRSIYSVRWMASELGLTEKPVYWSKKDMILLAQYYTTLPLEELADKLKRSLPAIRKKAALLNISKNYTKTNNEAIEKNVPFFKGKTGEFMQLLNNMDIGDSFQYPFEDRQTVANCVARFADKLFRTKDIDGKTRRIWRLL